MSQKQSVRLNQIIAVEKGVKSRCHQDLTQAHHGLQKQELLSGIARTYTPKDDDGDRLPDENTRVQIRAEEVLQQTGLILTELFDVTATKDWANCEARADVVLPNGEKLLENVPVAYLLFLEKQLVDLHTFVKKLPVLDPAFAWKYDSASDCMVTDSVETLKTKKVMKNHVLAEATDKHPAQIQTYNEDVVVGKWSTVKFSGALEAKRVRTLLTRVEELQKAVKLAREQANMFEVTQQHVGATVFSYLFGR